MHNNHNDPLHFTSTFPLQSQLTRPGLEYLMNPKPTTELESKQAPHPSDGKSVEKITCITGENSGIGRTVAIAFAK